MPSSENPALSHNSLSFAATSLNTPIPNTAIPANNTCPRPTTLSTTTTFPEFVFGWQALFVALRSALTSVPFLRLLPLFPSAPQLSNPTNLSSSTHSLHMSSRTSDTLHSPTSTTTVLSMGATTSTDVTMTPVSHSSDSTMSTSSSVSKDAPTNPNAKPPRSLAFASLPDELIAMCYANLSAADLVALEHVSLRFRNLIAYDSVCWKRCTEARWGHLSTNSVILGAAARHAGTWKHLYSEKARTDRANAPWLTLCKSETSAILDVIKGEKTPSPTTPVYWAMATEEDPIPSSPPKESVVPMATSSPVSVMGSQGPVGSLSVVLLVDASSSVTDDDFDAMKSFARALVDNLRVTLPESYVGVVQFNQHPKVEVGLTNVCKSKLSTSIDNMEQLMGSTDIAAPIRRARQILAEADVRPGDRAIVLLTDGQTHADELQESEREARKASEELGARLYTLGVGRDIDEVGLGRVAAGSEGGMHFTLRRLVPSK